MLRDLQITITHTPAITTTVERYVSPMPYAKKGGRKKKEHAAINTTPSEDVKRCSIANSKRTFQGIVHANFHHGFCMLTLAFSSKCSFNTKDYTTCRDKFYSFWKKLKRCKELAHVDLRYVGAIEFQRNGNVHFHILCRIPKEFRKLLKSKWKHGNLHYEQSYGSALDAPKIASYLTKGIHDDRLSAGKKRFLGGRYLERPTILTFKSRKILDFLLQRNGQILDKFKSSYGFTFTALLTDATIDELESFAESENEELELSLLEKFESIQYVNKGGLDYVYA